MTKIPRDINGTELASLLKRYGYSIIRQTGSHIRLTSNFMGEHHITIPRHNPLKIGTLSSIIRDKSEFLKKDKNEILTDLFGNS